MFSNNQLSSGFQFQASLCHCISIVQQVKLVEIAHCMLLELLSLLLMEELCFAPLVTAHLLK